MKFDDRGREVLSQVPVAVPLGVSVPETLEQKMLRFERQRQLARHWELSNYNDSDFSYLDDLDDLTMEDFDEFEEGKSTSFEGINGTTDVGTSLPSARVASDGVSDEASNGGQTTSSEHNSQGSNEGASQ